MDDRKNAAKPLPGQNAESMFNAKRTNRFFDAIQTVALGVLTGVKSLWPF